TKLGLGLRDPSGKEADGLSYVSSGLHLKIDNSVENRIVHNLIGYLSYRNREQIIRLLNRLVRWAGVDDTRRLDMLQYWADIAGVHLVGDARGYYVNSQQFERWRKQFHALDEDLPVLCLLVRRH